MDFPGNRTVRAGVAVASIAGSRGRRCERGEERGFINRSWWRRFARIVFWWEIVVYLL